MAAIYGLPSYIHLDNGKRAFLNLTTDIRGRWNAGYYEYVDERCELPAGHYRIHDPVVQDCETVEEAAQALAIAMAIKKELR